MTEGSFWFGLVVTWLVFCAAAITGAGLVLAIKEKDWGWSAVAAMIFGASAICLVGLLIAWTK